jgi:hypothetical protein
VLGEEREAEVHVVRTPEVLADARLVDERSEVQRHVVHLGAVLVARLVIPQRVFLVVVEPLLARAGVQERRIRLVLRERHVALILLRVPELEEGVLAAVLLGAPAFPVAPVSAGRRGLDGVPRALDVHDHVERVRRDGFVVAVRLSVRLQQSLNRVQARARELVVVRSEAERVGGRVEVQRAVLVREQRAAVRGDVAEVDVPDRALNALRVDRGRRGLQQRRARLVVARRVVTPEHAAGEVERRRNDVLARGLPASHVDGVGAGGQAREEPGHGLRAEVRAAVGGRVAEREAQDGARLDRVLGRVVRVPLLRRRLLSPSPPPSPRLGGNHRRARRDKVGREVVAEHCARALERVHARGVARLREAGEVIGVVPGLVVGHGGYDAVDGGPGQVVAAFGGCGAGHVAQDVAVECLLHLLRRRLLGGSGGLYGRTERRAGLHEGRQEIVTEHERRRLEHGDASLVADGAGVAVRLRARHLVRVVPSVVVGHGAHDAGHGDGVEVVAALVGRHARVVPDHETLHEGLELHLLRRLAAGGRRDVLEPRCLHEVDAAAHEVVRLEGDEVVQLLQVGVLRLVKGLAGHEAAADASLLGHEGGPGGVVCRVRKFWLV